MLKLQLSVIICKSVDYKVNMLRINHINRQNII